METSANPGQTDRSGTGRSRISFESIASRSSRYRPDVDGLRAVAVMAVLFFHLGIGSFRNGFVGVDIFYVISGYLITSLIANDLAGGRFSLVSFYERRMRRIFPALFAVLFLCILVANVLLDPEEMTRFGKALLTTTFFTSNFYFWHSASPLGYFDAVGRPPALLHTWSLAVEEQFYLFFPVTLYLLFRWAKKRVTAWLLFLVVVSFALNIWATEHKPVIAFYFLAPRAWELLVGALLALKAVPVSGNRILREVVALLGLGMILISFNLSFHNMPFPGYIVLLPCIGTWLVIYSGESGPSFVKALLSWRPLVFIGVLSYSLYLFHWPVIVFSKHLPFHLSETLEIAFVLLFSMALAFLSFEYIERPFRGSASSYSRRQVFAFGLAASVVSATFGLAAVRSRGLPERYDPRTRQLVAANLERTTEFDGSCRNYKTEVRSVGDIKFCNLGDQLPHKIMFWGDSHVEQLFPAIKDLYSRGALRDRGVVLAVAAGCLPDEHLNNRGDGFHCDMFAKFAGMRAQWQDVDLVFLGFSTWLTRWDHTTCLSINEKCTMPLSQDALQQRLVADLVDQIHALKRGGKGVIVCLPFPIFSERIPEVEINNAVFGRFGFFVTPKEITSPSFREQIRAAAISAGAEIFDPRGTLCTRGRCITEAGGVSLYKDESHLAESQVKILEDGLRTALEREIAERTPLPSPMRPQD